MDMKNLLSIAPNFMADKDEDWMSSLPLEKKTFIVDSRAEILSISEQIENLDLAYRNQLVSLRNAGQDKKEQAKAEYTNKAKSFRETRNEKIRELVPVLRRLKGIALELKNRHEADSSKKKRRLQDMLDPSLEMDPNVELVTDDYLPTYINSYLPQQTSSSSQSKKKQKSTRNKAESVPNILIEKSPAKTRDTFFDGVEDDSDRKILADLRSIIIKYNCRDRALKAIESITLRDKRIASMDKISQLVELMKCSDDQ